MKSLSVNRMVLRVGVGAAIIAPIFILAVSLLSVYSGKNWSDARVQQSQRVGNAIVLALENYRKDRGLYPDKLLDLVPEYLASVQPPAAGAAEWRYQPEADRFRLSFATRDGYPSCHYVFSAKDWYEDR